MNRMPKPVTNSTVAAPKSGSASSSSATNSEQRHRLDEPVRSAAQLVLAAHGVARDEDEREHARQLGRLEVEAQHADPAPAAVDHVPEPGIEHERTAARPPRSAAARPSCSRYSVRHAEHRCAASTKPTSAQHAAGARGKRTGRRDSLLGDRDRRRRHHDQAEQHDGRDHQRPSADRRASACTVRRAGASCASSCTAAANTSPRCA